jgi:SAM-dependent methyltransferase
MAHEATLSRSITLFRAFLREQSDPDLFYGTLAADTVGQVSRHVPLDGAVVLDVGGGPGYFAGSFRAAGARYVQVEPEAAALGCPPGTVQGRGEALPVLTATADVCFSSNVLEHVPAPWAMAAEMARVTKPGGTVFVAFTPWLSPWGGHETAPWHYLGGERARRRYRRRHGREPKNRFGVSLFPVSVAGALRWARGCPDVEVVAAFPRYHPWWAVWVVAVPGLREVLCWNFVLVLRRR